MANPSIRNRILRFNWCDSRFYPYIEKVLSRLPEEIAFKEVLDDLTFDIVSFGSDAAGIFYPLSHPARRLIVLHESLLRAAEFQIIHTIAHELAHKVVEKGHTGLYEKEAEELLEK